MLAEVAGPDQRAAKKMRPGQLGWSNKDNNTLTILANFSEGLFQKDCTSSESVSFVHVLGVKREITSRSLNDNKESAKNKECYSCKVVVLLI